VTSSSPPPSYLMSLSSTTRSTVLDECVPSKVESACFSPCSQYLAVLCQNGTLYIWRIAARRSDLRVKREAKRISGSTCNLMPYAHSPPSLLLASFKHLEGTPFFTPVIVKKINAKRECGVKCFFSHSGHTLSIVMSNSLHYFHFSAEFGTLVPCCTFQPPSGVGKRERLSRCYRSSPSFDTGQVERVNRFPDYWLSFADARVHEGENIWRCSKLKEGSDSVISEARQQTARGNKVTGGTHAISCGGHLLKCEIDWNGFDDLGNEMKKKRFSLHAWSSSGNVMGILVHQDREAYYYPRAGILLLLAQYTSLRFLQWIEMGERGNKPTYMFDIQFGPNSDRFLFAHIRYGGDHFLHVYRKREDEGEVRSQLSTSFSYQRVQKVKLEFEGSWSRTCTFFSPSLSHLYTWDGDNNAVLKFKLPQGEIGGRKREKGETEKIMPSFILHAVTIPTSSLSFLSSFFI